MGERYLNFAKKKNTEEEQQQQQCNTNEMYTKKYFNILAFFLNQTPSINKNIYKKHLFNHW